MAPSKAQVSAKKRMKYDPNNITRAMAAVPEGMSKKLASKSFGIPRATLLDKLAGRVPVKPPLEENLSLLPMKRQLW